MERLTRLLVRISARSWLYRDFTTAELRDALIEFSRLPSRLPDLCATGNRPGE